MSDRRWCPACKQVIPQRNADACPRCGGRAEQMSLEQAAAHEALNLLQQSAAYTADGTPVLDDAQIEACRFKIEEALKKQPGWPNTGWFNDGEFDRCLATVESLVAQIDRLAKFIMADVPGEPSESEGACDCAIRIIRNLKEKLGMGQFLTLSAEALAKAFHETYEGLAPDFGYETREESAKPWEEVPEDNKRLMVATCESILSRYGIAYGWSRTKEPEKEKCCAVMRADLAYLYEHAGADLTEDKRKQIEQATGLDRKVVAVEVEALRSLLVFSSNFSWREPTRKREVEDALAAVLREWDEKHAKVADR